MGNVHKYRRVTNGRESALCSWKGKKNYFRGKSGNSTRTVGSVRVINIIRRDIAFPTGREYFFQMSRLISPGSRPSSIMGLFDWRSGADTLTLTTDATRIGY